MNEYLKLKYLGYLKWSQDLGDVCDKTQL